MTDFVVLDTGPLGLLAYAKANEQAERCNAWAKSLLAAGTILIIPEIADYELRRELLRLQLTKGILKLESFRTVPGFEYLPITTAHMRAAAELWAESRRSGKPTSDAEALDGDVILCAQAIALMNDMSRVITASTNFRHISRFIPAAHWTEIAPSGT